MMKMVKLRARMGVEGQSSATGEDAQGTTCLNSAWDKITGLHRSHPCPRTSNCFKCGKTGHFRRECCTYAICKEVLEMIDHCFIVVPSSSCRKDTNGQFIAHGDREASHCVLADPG